MPGHKLYENGWTLEGRDARKQALRVWWLTEWGDARSLTLLSEWFAQSGAMPETSSVGGAVAHEWDQLDIDVMENFVVSANRGHGNCVHLR
jgi:hypothetical protein